MAIPLLAAVPSFVKFAGGAIATILAVEAASNYVEADMADGDGPFSAHWSNIVGDGIQDLEIVHHLVGWTSEAVHALYSWLFGYPMYELVSYINGRVTDTDPFLRPALEVITFKEKLDLTVTAGANGTFNYAEISTGHPFDLVKMSDTRLIDFTDEEDWKVLSYGWTLVSGEINAFWPMIFSMPIQSGVSVIGFNHRCKVMENGIDRPMEHHELDGRDLRGSER